MLWLETEGDGIVFEFVIQDSFVLFLLWKSWCDDVRFTGEKIMKYIELRCTILTELQINVKKIALWE